jgi:hypothetical protein
VAGEGLEAQKYFVYFKLSNRTDDAKDPLREGEAFPRSCQNKKGSGAKSIAPHFSPVSRTANSTARFVRVVA